MPTRLFEGKYQSFKATGAVNAGGTVEFVQAGTATPAATYSDWSLSATNSITGGVTLDSEGRALIFLDSSLTYDVTVKDSSASTIESVSNVTVALVDSEVETSYNNQVATVTKAQAEDRTDTTVYRWTPQRVHQAVAKSNSDSEITSRMTGSVSGNTDGYAYMKSIILHDGTDYIFLSSFDSVIKIFASLAASGAEGLDTGAEASSTWYTLFAVYNDSTSTLAGLWSKSTLTGTTTATTTSKLVDNSETFQTKGIQINDMVINTTDDTTTLVSAIDSETTLSLADDIFTTGENYTIVKTKPTTLPSGYTFWSKPILAGYNDGSSNLIPGIINNNIFMFTTEQTDQAATDIDIAWTAVTLTVPSGTSMVLLRTLTDPVTETTENSLSVRRTGSGSTPIPVATWESDARRVYADCWASCDHNGSIDIIHASAGDATTAVYTVGYVFKYTTT